MTEPTRDARPRGFAGLIQRVVDVRPEEIASLFWSFAYFFTLLSSYFIIRPLREEMGVAGGVRNLQWLFTATLVAMLVVHPPFAALVARFPRRRFIAITYRFFIANLLVFFGLLQIIPDDQRVWLGRVFFVWTSVFNLFVVSVFWGFMADLFTSGQGKRLFGFIGLGGTLGGLAGSTLTVELVTTIGTANLLLISAVLLELTAQCAARLSRIGVHKPSTSDARSPSDRGEAVIGGSALAGVTRVVKSPYLLGICAYMLLFTFGSTVLYFQQAEFASQIGDSAARTAFFARIEQYVQLLTLIVQAFLTGRILKAIGIAGTLTLLPALSAVGFLTLGLSHVLWVFVAFQVLRRAGEFAVAKPAREILYTVLRREDKYKSKNFIDTFVYRAGDQVGSWSYELMRSLGLAASSIALVTAPIAGLWLTIAWWLGRKQEAIAQSGLVTGAEPAPAPSTAFR